MLVPPLRELISYELGELLREICQASAHFGRQLLSFGIHRLGFARRKALGNADPVCAGHLDVRGQRETQVGGAQVGGQE
ncbi:MAG: hypothetical protein JO044_13325, partial [Mycobacteriaceae bacterium]|nr:hypothetical protein [Mycobacteriaceae bacterium]